MAAALARRSPRRRSGWNLDAFSDEELEALLPLAERWAEAREDGREPAWTAGETALLERLWAKQAGEEA